MWEGENESLKVSDGFTLSATTKMAFPMKIH